MVQSSSAAGKTTLMDAILAFLLQEARTKFSAMTGQSLFYMLASDLRHKILAIVEQEGADRASYALKLLQSEGELRLASTGKDPNTGRTETQEYHVQGPTMIFLTTTNLELDEELQNRCIVLTVDESREQTERIHALQREARTEVGLERRSAARSCWARNAQRLLQPLPVFNPYAAKLRFLSDRLRTRRDHEKYLILIDALALLFQHQRERRSVAGRECGCDAGRHRAGPMPLPMKDSAVVWTTCRKSRPGVCWDSSRRWRRRREELAAPPGSSRIHRLERHGP